MSENFRITKPDMLDADIVVIGSGAGGATVAATAAELGYSTLLLEEGPYVPPERAPVRMADAFKKLWRNGGLTAAYGLPPVSYAEGRCVGGTTEINSAIFQRAPENLLDDWAERYHIRDFNAGKLTAYYDWAAKIVNASLTPDPLGPPSEVLAKAGKAMGWQVKALERGQKNGAKQSMTTTLIPQFLAKGGRLIADAKVRHLVMDGRRIRGVGVQAISNDNQKYEILVRARKVFLCAGAIQSPALLQGIGFDRAGQNLRLHPTIKCLTLFNEEINAQNYRLPLTAITEFMPDMRIGGSIFTPGTFGLALAEDWQQRASYIDQLRHAAIYYAMVRAKGKGTVYGMPAGTAPIVTYKLAKEDWHELGKAVARLGQALLKAGAKCVLPSINGHAGWQNEIEAAIALEKPLPHIKTQMMSVHLFGSCAMGEDANLCITDSFGRVHGTENLYVADAGLIPESPGVNPQATVMALARRNTLLNLDKHT